MAAVLYPVHSQLLGRRLHLLVGIGRIGLPGRILLHFALNLFVLDVLHTDLLLDFLHEPKSLVSANWGFLVLA